MSALLPVWRCSGCGRVRPHCDGGSDDMPEHCDRCWAVAQMPWYERALVWLVGVDADHRCGACAPEEIP